MKKFLLGICYLLSCEVMAADYVTSVVTCRSPGEKLENVRSSISTKFQIRWRLFDKAACADEVLGVTKVSRCQSKSDCRDYHVRIKSSLTGCFDSLVEGMVVLTTAHCPAGSVVQVQEHETRQQQQQQDACILGREEEYERMMAPLRAEERRLNEEFEKIELELGGKLKA